MSKPVKLKILFADERSTNFKIVDELIVPTIIKDNNEQD